MWVSFFHLMGGVLLFCYFYFSTICSILYILLCFSSLHRLVYADERLAREGIAHFGAFVFLR